MSKSEASAYFREGYYIDIKRSDGLWTTGVIKSIDPVRGYNVQFEDNGKPLQIWLGKASDRIAPFRQATVGKELNSVLRKPGATVRDIAVDVKTALSRRETSPMSLIQTCRGELFFRVLELVELQPLSESERTAWQETVVLVVEGCMQWLQSQWQSTEIWVSLLKSKDAYLSSLEKAEASCWPEMFEMLGKLVTVKISSKSISRGFRPEQQPFAIPQEQLKAALDVLAASLTQRIIPFHMLGSYPLWDLFPIFGTSAQQYFLDALQVVASRPHLEPRYFDLSALSTLLLKLTTIQAQLGIRQATGLEEMVLDIAKDLGRDRERLEARIQSIRVYTLAIERNKESNGLRGEDLAGAILEAAGPHLVAETNTEAITLSFPLLSFLVDQGRLRPEDFTALIRPQGHESVVTAKFQLAIKLAPTLSPDLLTAVIDTWTQLPLSHSTISAMKEFTIQANVESWKNSCFIPFFQRKIVQGGSSAAEVLTALIDTVQLPAFYSVQGEVLAGLANALPNSAEALFSFTHLFRKCEKTVIEDFLTRQSPNLLDNLVDLALQHQKLCPKDYPQGVILSSVLDLVLEVAKNKGANSLSFAHLSKLQRLLVDESPEERIELFFEWLSKANYDLGSNSDLTSYCAGLLTNPGTLPAQTLKRAGCHTLTFFQQVFALCNYHCLQMSGNEIVFVTSLCVAEEMGLNTLFQLATEARNETVRTRAVTFITQLMYRSQAGQSQLINFYFAFAFDTLQQVKDPDVQLGILRLLLAIVECYEQLTGHIGSPGGPITVYTRYQGRDETWQFPQTAKLGDVRRALGCPYHSTVFKNGENWYFFAYDDTYLTQFGYSIQFEVVEGDYYQPLYPLEVIAGYYAQALVECLDSPDLQVAVWTLLRKAIAAPSSQFALSLGGLQGIMDICQQSSPRQLLLLSVLETQSDFELSSRFSLGLLEALGEKTELQLTNLQAPLKRAYCCKLVAVASLVPFTTMAFPQEQADRILVGLFRLYYHYISASAFESVSPQEPFPWITLVSSWIGSQQCSSTSVLSNFLSSDIILKVFFSDMPKPIQFQFAENLSQLATLFSSDDIDKHLKNCLGLCFEQKERDTQAYFICLKEAMERRRSDFGNVALQLRESLEKMDKLTVSESTLKGCFEVVGQEIAAGRLNGAEKLALRLTTHFLFPSSANKYPLCTSISTQEAGFALLFVICLSSSQALSSVLQSLSRFHLIQTWRKASLKSWVVPAQEEKTLAGFVGLRNAGATCYLNSTLQQFFMLRGFRNQITLIPRLQPGVTAEVAKLLLKLQYSEKPYVQTKGLWGVYLNWDGEPINPREQMDVEEFLSGLLTKMEEELLPIASAHIVQNTFQSTTINTIRGLSPCTHQSTRPETHFTIPIEVKNKRSVRESLQTLIQKEKMEGDSAYSCEDCGRKVTAEKYQRFQTLPEVLVLALRRFEYSVELGRRKKINDAFEFEEELDMAAYMEDADLMSMQSVHKSARTLYSLTGIVLHIGEAEAGHYIALAKEENRWIQFNDTQVSVIEDKERREMAVGQQEGPFAQTSAYLLIYQKQTNAQPWSLETIRQHTGSQAPVIGQKNETYLCKKSVFRRQYLNFVLGLLTQLRPDQDLLRFAVADFLTIHSRCQMAEPALLSALYDGMQSLSPVQEWFVRSLTSEAALREFIIECPLILIRKFLASLFHQAVNIVPAETLQFLLRQLVAAVTHIEPPLSDRHASLFELIYCLTRKDLQAVVDCNLPGLIIAQMLKQRVAPQAAVLDASPEWGCGKGTVQSSAENSDLKLNYAFQLAILQRCLTRLKPDLQREMSSQAFMKEAVSGAFNKFGGIKLASIYSTLSQKQPILLDQYLDCLKNYFQTNDYDRFRVAAVQTKRLIGHNSNTDGVRKVMGMLFQALEMNKGFVLAAATLIKLIYKLITSKPAVLQWYRGSSDASRAIEAWDREYRRFSSGSTNLSLTKVPQFYQPSIYQVLPDFPSTLQAFVSQRFRGSEQEGDSDAETYEMRFEGGAEMQLSGGVVRVQVEKDMGLMVQGKYVEGGVEKLNFIATDDDRLMPDHTKLPTSF